MSAVQSLLLAAGDPDRRHLVGEPAFGTPAPLGRSYT
jgi:hypothetical protein